MPNWPISVGSAPPEEERMVDAMRKAADLVVKGVSTKGTETTDTFSLKGLSQALDKLAQDCKR